MKFIFALIFCCFMGINPLFAEEVVGTQKQNTCLKCTMPDKISLLFEDDPDLLSKIMKDIRECKEHYDKRYYGLSFSCPRDLFRYKMRVLLDENQVSDEDIEKLAKRMDAMNKDIQCTAVTKKIECDQAWFVMWESICGCDSIDPYVYYSFLSEPYKYLSSDKYTPSDIQKREKKYRKKYLGY